MSKFTKPKANDTNNDLIMSKKFDESILIKQKDETPLPPPAPIVTPLVIEKPSV